MAQILVVDDTKNIRKTVELTLKKAGHEIQTAEDGNEGLRLFSDGAPWDLTLVDQQMPGLQGDEFVIEARRRDPMARLLMMTAFATPELAAQVMQAGALDFLRKPFTTDVLRSAVDVALSHPRQAAPVSDFDPSAHLTLPGEPGYVSPRTSSRINGFSFWQLLEAPGETQARLNPPGFDLGRSFQVRLPDGAYTRCFVGITPHVRAQIEANQARTIADDDYFWEEMCRDTLFRFLVDKAQTPPDILPVYDAPGTSSGRDGFASWKALFGR